jgi:16S rRNA processing protein RimM
VAAEPYAGLTLARVLRPWGRRGEVAAQILTDFPERLVALRNAWLADGRTAPRAVHVLSCRVHLGQAIFHFAGSRSIDDAERLRGLEVQVPLAERAPIGAGRYYISELIGCAVWEATRDFPVDAAQNDERATGDVAGGSPLGTVADVQRIDIGRAVGKASGAAHATVGSGANNNVNVAESWVLAVATPRGEMLIPLAAEICTRIDTAARRIEVRLPEGLAELNQHS